MVSGVLKRCMHMERTVQAVGTPPKMSGSSRQLLQRRLYPPESHACFSATSRACGFRGRRFFGYTEDSVIRLSHADLHASVHDVPSKPALHG